MGFNGGALHSEFFKLLCGSGGENVSGSLKSCYSPHPLFSTFSTVRCKKYLGVAVGSW